MQVSDLQENFKLLSNARSLKGLGKQYCHILRGTLLTTNVNLFFKQKEEEIWQEVFLSNNNCLPFLPLLSENETIQINLIKNEPISAAVTLPLIDGNYFGILIGRKLDKTDFTEMDKIVIQMFILLLDHSYQSFINYRKEKELNFQLNHRVLQLNSLIDTGIEITKLRRRNSLLPLALKRVVSLTNASKGILTVYRDGKKVGRRFFPMRLSKKDVENAHSVISTRVRFKNLEYELTLLDKESRKGLAEFDGTDELMLNAFARQVLAAVENDYLHQEALEKESLEKELTLAGDIQKKLLPEKMPEIEGYDIAGVNIPSKEVGGDYYQVICLNDGRVALIIGDVSGKGVPAGLLVSTLDACLEAYLELKLPLSEMTAKINSIIYRTSPADKFITFFIAILTPSTGELDIINAGHDPGFLLRKGGKLEKIEAGGIPLGMMDMGLPFSGTKTKIAPGERFLLYTDGIPEAMNSRKKEYTPEKLEEFFRNHAPSKASSFINALVSDVKKFTGDTPQSDDITALYLIRQS